MPCLRWNISFFFHWNKKEREGKKEGKELEGEGWISVGVIVKYMCLVLLLENTGHFKMFGNGWAFFDQWTCDLTQKV